MKKVKWKLEYLSLPHVIRYCKKCGEKTEFVCSEKFRVNARKKYLHIWLIYKCINCDTTWNSTIYACITPQSLAPKVLEGFHKNDKELVERFAMNMEYLNKNGAEVCLPSYSIIGDSFVLDEAVELEIKSDYPLPIKVSSIVRDKLQLSQGGYTKLVEEEKIKSMSGLNLKKCKLNNGISLIFQP